MFTDAGAPFDPNETSVFTYAVRRRHFPPVLTKGNSAAFQQCRHSTQSDADPRDVGPIQRLAPPDKRLTPVKWWSNDSGELRLV